MPRSLIEIQDIVSGLDISKIRKKDVAICNSLGKYIAQIPFAVQPVPRTSIGNGLGDYIGAFVQDLKISSDNIVVIYHKTHPLFWDCILFTSKFIQDLLRELSGWTRGQGTNDHKVRRIFGIDP